MHYKIFELLRFHKIFENERYFGKQISFINNSMMTHIL